MEKTNNRVFLDSNVILSGLFSSAGAPRLILDLLTLGLPVLSGLTGRFNLIEIERTLERKLPAALPAYVDRLPYLNLEIVPSPSPDDLRPIHGSVGDKDVPVLASAIQGGAGHFVTGDKDLLAKITRMDGLLFRPSSPAEFLDQIVPSILKGAPPGPSAGSPARRIPSS